MQTERTFVSLAAARKPKAPQDNILVLSQLFSFDIDTQRDLDDDNQTMQWYFGSQFLSCNSSPIDHIT
jgi:hypothetical protein